MKNKSFDYLLIVKNILLLKVYHFKNKIEFSPFMLFFPCSIIYMEFIFRAALFHSIGNGLFYIILLSIPAGILLYLISSFFSENINYILSLILTGLLSLIYCAEAVYYDIFNVFPSVFSLKVGGKIFQFWQDILNGIWHQIIVIIFLFIPFIALFFIKKIHIKTTTANWAQRLCIITAGLLLQTAALISIAVNTSGSVSPKYLYYDTFMQSLSAKQFGIITTIRLDISNVIKDSITSLQRPANTTPIDPSSALVSSEEVIEESSSSSVVTEDEEPVIKYNIMDIDFESLIANETDHTLLDMHQYFMNLEPTEQNEYTGLFEGKNLIFITAESFSSYVVDENLTPTLYKLVNEGFQFENFYNPIWGVSTTDGEYVACTGLLPKSGIWSFYRSSFNYMPFCLGNQFQALGYSTRAYHNHLYDYYCRDLSHPNMGYEYRALGLGLEVAQTWPESDVEMMELTIDDYIDDESFHTYYMTVSGHMNYTFDGNYIASKNSDAVADLTYSEGPKAYLAANLELEYALTILMEALEEKGIADDTVIVLSADHYPYGLTTEELNELAGHEIEQSFELYKSTLIIWSKGMTPVTISKPCSSLDIIPTVSNLMRLEYDSRLLMGTDILSNTSPLVIFQDYSWITDLGSYNSITDVFIPANNTDISKEYIADTQKLVQNKFSYSDKILEENYYRCFLGK